MFKLGFKLLTSRKKWFLIMTISFSLILSLITSIFTASESIKMGLIKHAYNDYGEHTLVILNSNKTKEELYEKDVEKVGTIQLVGTIDLKNNKAATVGIVDSEAIELGHLSLIEGTFPTAENEVAIEASYLSYIDDSWEIGEKRTLRINDVNKELTLTGVIKDYSAKWSVSEDLQKGVNDFPNVILSERNSDFKVKYQNFLIKLKGNINDIEEKAYDLLGYYTGFFNHRLYYNGLSDLKPISLFSTIFQVLTLITSFLAIYSLLFFFNINQQKKFAILKTVGSSNLSLLKINLSQILVMIMFGFLFAIPLQIGLHNLIIKNTFNVSSLESSNLIFISSVLLIWILVIFVLSLISSIMALKEIQKKSINSLLRDRGGIKKNINQIPIRTNDFAIRKVFLQALSNLKHTIIIVVTLTLSILILSLSVYIEKESHGIWNIEEDYYLNSQQTFSYEIVDNLNVLKQEGLTFLPEDIEDLEKNPSIEFIEKHPFMIDVHPLLTEEQMTSDIQKWFMINSETNSRYEEYYIIPNVKYLLLDKETFNDLYPNKNFEELLGKVILYNPITTNTPESNNLKGEMITFIQKKRNNNSYDTYEWNFEILEVVNKPFSISINESLEIEYDEFVILIAEDTAINEGIFRGYHELVFYLKNHVQEEEREKIESEIIELIALTPGNLYQNISKFIEEDKRMSDFIGYLGKLTYFVSALLSIINLTVIMFSKYKLQKREWGIYFTLGMRKKDVYFLLFLEMFLYLLIATIISFVIFGLIIFSNNTEYPSLYYLTYNCLSILIILILLTLGWYVIKKKIDKQSILSLIRIEE